MTPKDTEALIRTIRRTARHSDTGSAQQAYKDADKTFRMIRDLCDIYLELKSD